MPSYNREYGRRLEEQKDLLSLPPSPPALFHTLQTDSADAAGKCRSGTGGPAEKFHLDAAFIRRVMNFERSSPLLSSSSSSCTATSAASSRQESNGAVKPPQRAWAAAAKKSIAAEESTTEKSGPAVRDDPDLGRRRQRRRAKQERPVKKTAARFVYRYSRQLEAGVQPG